MIIEFTVPSIPIAQPRPRTAVINNRPVVMSAPKKHPVNQFKASVAYTARAHYKGPVLQGPVKLTLVFVMPRPQNMIWKTKPMPREWHTKKPDKDNMEKAFKDALSGVIWRDDSQVCHGDVLKVVASGDEQPHVFARIESPIAERVEEFAKLKEEALEN